MTEIGTIIDGKYEVLKEIGRGGMSTVYLAMDRRLNKQWAVKEIRKKGTGANDEIVVNSLLAEANLMKRLDHPALPRIVDIIDNGVTIYVIMDYIEGESLDKILKEFGVQDEELVIEWAKQICDALSYLHSQKPRPIVYRDMKPANIMLKPEGNIKIIDFGIAREYKEQNLSDTKVLGTRGFAPPEAYNGQTTPRSDIYSLGMTMHNLLTGVDPRMGDGYVPVRQINPNLSEGIELIIDKCVQPAEENRYQSCADLLYDLEHPDLITSGYKKKQKGKIIKTVVPFALSIIMAFSGIGATWGAKETNELRYNALLKNVNDIESYKEAIELYPEKIDAYERVVKYYEEIATTEGLTDVDKNEIASIFSDFLIKSEAEIKDGEEKYEKAFVELVKSMSAEEKTVFFQKMTNINYRLGEMLYLYYQPVDDYGNVGSSEKVYGVALKYFEINKNWVEDGYISTYDKKELCDYYYEICDFYYNIVIGEKTAKYKNEDFQHFFNSMKKTFVIVKNREGAEAIEQMMWYSNAMIIFGNKVFVEDLYLSGVSFEEMDELVIDIKETAQSSPVRNSSLKAKELQKSIEEKYKLYEITKNAVNK